MARSQLTCVPNWRVAIACLPLLATFPESSFGGRQATVLELASNGETDYLIVTAARSPQCEQFAARELRRYLSRVTGADFCIIDEPDVPVTSRRIDVGCTRRAAAIGISGHGLSDEQWVIRPAGEDLIIAGGRPRGTLYAVYEFLERLVGCHWLDETTDIIPSLHTLRLRVTSSTGRPAFWYRFIATDTACLRPGRTHEDELFLLRNKANDGIPARYASRSGSPAACQMLHVYPEGWYDDHPECFSMRLDGTRERSQSGSEPGHLCLTNPDVPKLVARDLCSLVGRDRRSARAQSRPTPCVYDIRQNDDNNPICLCRNCRQLSANEGSDSGLMIHFINQVTSRVGDRYPPNLLQALAYTTTQEPPRSLSPNENVMIRLCDLGGEFRGEWGAELFKPLSHRHNARFVSLLQEWSRVTNHLAVWDYWVMCSPNDRFPTPYVNVSSLKPDIELFLDAGVESVFVECEQPETSSFFSLKRWLGYKLLQDPRQPLTPLLKTFMEGYYGPAADIMRTYLRYVEKRTASVKERMSTMKERERPYLDLKFFVKTQRLLDRAEMQCRAGTPELLHVRRERIPLDAALYNLWEQLEQQQAGDRGLPFDRAAILMRYEANRDAQMTAFRLGRSLSEGRTELADEISRYRGRPLVEQRRLSPSPQLVVPRMDSVAGGLLRRVDWGTAAPLSNWAENSGYPTDRDVSGALIHDGECLYIRLEEACDTSGLRVAADVWAGDDWEAFFAAQRSKPPYYQLAVTPDGRSVAYRWQEHLGQSSPREWSNGVNVVSEMSESRWTVMLAVPLGSLPLARSPEPSYVYANFCRASGNATRSVAWSPNFDRSFHVLSRLGYLVLE